MIRASLAHEWESIQKGFDLMILAKTTSIGYTQKEIQGELAALIKKARIGKV